MKKKLLALVLTTSLLLSVTACGSKPASTDDATSGESTETTIEVEDASTEEEDTSSQEDADQDDELVTFSIPSTFYGESVTQEDLDATVAAEFAEYEGVSLVLNEEEGTVTCTLPKSVYTEMLNEITERIDVALAEIVNDAESYPSIVSIDSNESYDHFTITTTVESQDDLALTESMISLALVILSGSYQAFSNSEGDTPSVIVDFVNEESGDIIYTYDSANLE